MDMNRKAYEVEADQLLRGAAHPMDMRTIIIKNPKSELKRGMLIKVAVDGSYFVAGDTNAESEPLEGDAMSILGHSIAKNQTDDTLAVAVYVSGGFNSRAITGINDYTLKEKDILSAQKYGLYIHS